MFKIILFIISVFSLSAYSNYQILPYGAGHSDSAQMKAFTKTPSPDFGSYPSNQPRVHLSLTHSCTTPNLRSVNPIDSTADVLTLIKAKEGSNEKTLCMVYSYVRSRSGGENWSRANKEFIIGTYNNTDLSTHPDVRTVCDKTGVTLQSGSGAYDLALIRGGHRGIGRQSNYFSMSFIDYNFANILKKPNSLIDVKVYQKRRGELKEYPVSVVPDISRIDNPSVSLSFTTAQRNFGCGAYQSPLMLFFSDKRPSFLNISNFPLFRNKKTAWVEKDHVGYFLAIDLDQDGKISEKDELFGNDLKYLNGFESLKRFDSNRDGLISHKDERFKDLLLWNDKNGDGVGLKKELLPLHKKVKEISLNYTGENTVQTENALASGRSHFITKKGKKAEIIDYWFKPAK